MSSSAKYDSLPTGDKTDSMDIYFSQVMRAFKRVGVPYLVVMPIMLVYIGTVCVARYDDDGCVVDYYNESYVDLSISEVVSHNIAIFWTGLGLGAISMFNRKDTDSPGMRWICPVLDTGSLLCIVTALWYVFQGLLTGTCNVDDGGSPHEHAANGEIPDVAIFSFGLVVYLIVGGLYRSSDQLLYYELKGTTLGITIGQTIYMLYIQGVRLAFVVYMGIIVTYTDDEFRRHVKPLPSSACAAVSAHIDATTDGASTTMFKSIAISKKDSNNPAVREVNPDMVILVRFMIAFIAIELFFGLVASLYTLCDPAARKGDVIWWLAKLVIIGTIAADICIAVGVLSLVSGREIAACSDIEGITDQGKDYINALNVLVILISTIPIVSVMYKEDIFASYRKYLSERVDEGGKKVSELRKKFTYTKMNPV